MRTQPALLGRWWFGGLAASRVYRRVLLSRRSLPPEPRSERSPGLLVPGQAEVEAAIVELHAHDLPEIVALRADPHVSASDLAARFERGTVGFGARLRGDLVALAWGATAPTPMPYVWGSYAPGPGEQYVHDTWIHPAYRRRGLATALALALDRRAVARGLDVSVRATVPENREGRALHRRLGYRTFGMLRAVRLGPWVWHHRVWFREEADP